MAGTVQVDDRERRAPILPELIRLGLRPQVERLEVADYVIGGVYGVERKTVDDFVNSIIDKRLFEQARLLRESYEKPIVVVEGRLDEVVAARNISLNQIFGALLALIDMGVHVIQVSDPHQTALLIYILSKRLEKESSYVRPSKRRVLRKGRASLRDIQVNLIATLPGISYSTAKRILATFRTPRKFFQATPAELRKAGLGPKKVGRILEILDTDFAGALDSFLANAESREQQNEKR